LEKSEPLARRRGPQPALGRGPGLHGHAVVPFRVVGRDASREARRDENTTDQSHNPHQVSSWARPLWVELAAPLRRTPLGLASQARVRPIPAGSIYATPPRM